MPRVLQGMARLDYPANLGRGTHLKLAWKLGQELRHKPGAGAAPARQPAAQWSAYSAVTRDEASSNNALHKSKIYQINQLQTYRPSGWDSHTASRRESSVFRACRHQTDGYSRYNFLKGQTTVKRHSCNSIFFLCV